MPNPKIRSFRIVRENPRLRDCREEEKRDDKRRYNRITTQELERR